MDGSNWDHGKPLEDHYQTPTQASQTGDHYNRTEPWPIFIPTNMDYVKADFGYKEDPTDLKLGLIQRRMPGGCSHGEVGDGERDRDPGL